MTKQQHYAHHLLHIGCIERASTVKYRVFEMPFTPPSGKKPIKVYLGRCGAIRIGRKASETLCWRYSIEVLAAHIQAKVPQGAPCPVRRV